MKLILIARVSDVEQRKALPAQKLRLKQYAVGKDPKAEYYEFDESAHKDVRREFRKLVDHIKEQKEPVAVCFDKVDRYTRDSSQEEVRTLNTLVKNGKIQLHFPSDNLFIDKNSPAADLFRLGIGMALAKYYSDSIRDNVKRRFDQLLADKTWIGYAPIGYKNVHRGSIAKPIKTIEVDEERAPHIITIFEKRAAGMSYEAIAELVTANGMTSKSGRILNKSAIEKIVRNPFYHGTMLYMGKLYPHKYPPLISIELYNKCQDMRLQRRDQPTKYRSLPFTFNNLVKCKICERTISLFTARNNVYLTCSQVKSKCGNKTTAESLILPDIEELIASIPLQQEHLEMIIKEIRERHDTQQIDLNGRIESARNEYDQITARLKALTYERLDSVSNGKGIGAELFDEMVEELTNRQQELNQQLIKLTDSNMNFLTTASHLLDLAQRSKELFSTSNNLGRQKLLRFIVSNVYLMDKTLSYTVNDPYKTFITLNKKPQKGLNDTNWCG
ncbi:MAG TPA: recombinase family protein [Candidatus Saccharimonadales bacterium]|nr:recombinase family protein [Candidatus Saccharimonadales bacterium]